MTFHVKGFFILSINILITTDGGSTLSNDLKYPIQEVLLKIDVVPDENLDVEELKNFDSNITVDYPIETEARYTQGIIHLGKNKPAFTGQKTGKIGYVLMSKSKDKVLKSTVDSFSFHKLRPYQRWGPFIEEFKPLWEKYLQIASPKSIDKIGLRYINNIEIPENKILLNDYFNTKVELAEGLPQNVIELFAKIVIPFNDLDNSYAIITQAFNPNQKNKEQLSYIFDIDIFCAQKIDTKSEMLWEIIHKIKAKANYIFDNSITEKTRRLYNGLCSGASSL